MRRATQVAFHPKSPVLAVGYEDGWILLCRLADGAELLVRRTPDGTPTTGRQRAAISAMAWDADGKRLLFGAENGDAGLLTLPV